MTPPHDLIRKMLVNNSAAATWKALSDQGYTVSRSQCEVLRAVLIANGEAEPIGSSGGDAQFPWIADPAAGAENGSRNLLNAMQRYYEHYAFTHGCSVAAARLVLNYSRGQIEKMAA